MKILLAIVTGSLATAFATSDGGCEVPDKPERKAEQDAGRGRGLPGGFPQPSIHPAYSGVYPHLAVTNGGANESGIGAVMPWAGKLWYLTYPAHVFLGGNDKLYELDAGLNRVARPESVGGTHANRMIHRESRQMILGPYFIDAQCRVRAIPPRAMPGRITAVARHWKDPENKVYFATMEQGFYEVDVHSLDVKELHRDGNVGGKNILPGVHGKGCYTGQGRLVFTNNGRGGVLAEWDGSRDLASSGAWKIVDRNKYTDITGPGGVYGAPDEDAPLWAIGWDARSVLLNVRDSGRWSRFRLPKASYTQDADHGWYTEWPRIRAVGPGRLLLNAHDLFYRFPSTFRPANAAGIRPISTFLKMVVDYADWNGRLVMANNDASRQGNPILGCPQSNLWFGRWEDLGGFGRPAGWGGPWVRDPVKANEPSEPFLLAGFDRRLVHLTHQAATPVTFTLETDSQGDGNWTPYTSVTVPAAGYAYHVIPSAFHGEWIRVKADRDVSAATAYFHYSSDSRAAAPAIFESLPTAEQAASQSEGLLRPEGGSDMRLAFAATVVRVDDHASRSQPDDKSAARVGPQNASRVTGYETGYYVLGEDLRLRRTADPAAEKALRKRWTPKQDFEVDAASVVLKDGKGRRYRFPKGPELFSRPSASGWRRTTREVVTERNLMNLHGTFYEVPRDDSGGLAKARPIATHNRQIFDFASWRGMLVMSGVTDGAAAGGHSITSDDGKVDLWLGNVEDLWKLGPPRGEGGPWRNATVRAGNPSDPYLMTGYDRKTVQLSHDRPAAVRFTLEVDFLADGMWHVYQTFAVQAGQTLTHAFPREFSAHWVRVKTDTNCRATAWLLYSVGPS